MHVPSYKNIYIIIIFTAYVREHGTQYYGPEGQCLAKKAEIVTRTKQFEHSKMCIDHTTGFQLKPKNEKYSSKENGIGNIENGSKNISNDEDNALFLELSVLTKCFMGPGHINQQRKFKRRCLGIHPYPILFDRYV